MLAHDWFDWTNGAIGAAGLLLTGGALWQAAGAKQAATEAKRAVLLRNVAEGFAEISRYCSQLSIWIEVERYTEARIQLKEIQVQLAQFCTEFHLELRSVQQMLAGIEMHCAELLDDIANDDGMLLSTSELIKKSSLIENGVNTILGHLKAKVHKEEK